MSTVITSVDAGSPAERAGIRAGEQLLMINHHEIVDVLDYRFFCYDPSVSLRLREADGTTRHLTIEKEEGEDLGLNFDTYLMDEPRPCSNHCLFCFVDQMPPNMRDTLYFKDDDARLSFLMGNYITLTNLTEREAQRIIDLRISPINVSVQATEGVTEQDTKVAGLAHEAGKACIIVVNKWDLVEKDGKTMDKMREDIRRDLSYMTYAPILFISAATGQRVPRLFELINYVHSQACTRITTGMLNNVLEDAQTRVQPPTDKGKRLKIYYMTQVGVCPPHFVIFCNDRQLFHFSYQRYIENCIRNVFGLEGTPIILSIRQKGDKEE